MGSVHDYDGGFCGHPQCTPGAYLPGWERFVEFLWHTHIDLPGERVVLYTTTMAASVGIHSARQVRTCQGGNGSWNSYGTLTSTSLVREWCCTRLRWRLLWASTVHARCVLARVGTVRGIPRAHSHPPPWPEMGAVHDYDGGFCGHPQCTPGAYLPGWERFVEFLGHTHIDLPGERWVLCTTTMAASVGIHSARQVRTCQGGNGSWNS